MTAKKTRTYVYYDLKKSHSTQGLKSRCDINRHSTSQKKHKNERDTVTKTLNIFYNKFYTIGKYQ